MFHSSDGDFLLSITQEMILLGIAVVLKPAVTIIVRLRLPIFRPRCVVTFGIIRIRVREIIK